MTLEMTEVVTLGVLIGISLLLFLVVLPWLAFYCWGYRGCLQCGSELHDGAGHCLMCGHSLQQPRSLLNALILRLRQSEEPMASETTAVVPYHLWDKHSTDS